MNRYEYEWTDQFLAFAPINFDAQAFDTTTIKHINSDTERKILLNVIDDIKRVKILINKCSVKYNRIFMDSIDRYLRIVDEGVIDVTKAIDAMTELRRRLINDSNHSDKEIQNFLWSKRNGSTIF